MNCLSKSLALTAAIAALALSLIVGCARHQIAVSSDLRPQVKDAQAELAKQNATLAEQNKILQQQVETLKKAVDAATATGSYIDQAKGQGAKALAAGSNNPDVATPLTAQATTLDNAGTSNKETSDQLHAALDENGRLKATNTQLTSQVLALTAKLKSMDDAAAAGEKEKVDLHARVADLEKQLEDGRLSRLYLYQGLSIAAIVAGIAMAIWLPSTAKTVGYILVTIGASGLVITVFLIVWMAVFKWIVLAAFVAAAGYAAWSVYQHNGALTKTAQGVEGIKQDLQALATNHTVEAVRTAAGTVLTDWFGSADRDIKGVFHWLHSEFEAIVARVRSLIGSKPAVAPATAAAVNSPGNLVPQAAGAK